MVGPFEVTSFSFYFLGSSSLLVVALCFLCLALEVFPLPHLSFPKCKGISLVSGLGSYLNPYVFFKLQYLRWASIKSFLNPPLVNYF